MTAMTVHRCTAELHQNDRIRYHDSRWYRVDRIAQIGTDVFDTVLVGHGGNHQIALVAEEEFECEPATEPLDLYPDPHPDSPF